MIQLNAKRREESTRVSKLTRVSIRSTACSRFGRHLHSLNAAIGETAPREVAPRSVTRLVRALGSDGTSDSAAALYELYYKRLVVLACQKLQNASQRVVDAEDVASIAFFSFVESVSSGQFGGIRDRGDVWRLLATITERKAFDEIRRQASQKRGGGRVRGESVFRSSYDSGSASFDTLFASDGSTRTCPEEVAEDYDHLIRLLGQDSLKEVAELVLAGHSTSEIAKCLGRTQRTVQRRIGTIRKIWADKLSE
ncbi:ECF-type sigma factor [Roseiconus lacunae]|uniref:ECF-type sigma factor n=1 Tax=Roseiconus lacunae TaxID=2605694 RepID=UPI001E5888D1|nr:ECF-type sigma factor [Roseiconus lacunae]MCD0457862.1 RNA polymerase subunit sigma-70 [Roseiconus lacunae]